MRFKSLCYFLIHLSSCVYLPLSQDMAVPAQNGIGSSNEKRADCVGDKGWNCKRSPMCGKGGVLTQWNNIKESKIKDRDMFEAGQHILTYSLKAYEGLPGNEGIALFINREKCPPPDKDSTLFWGKDIKRLLGLLTTGVAPGKKKTRQVCGNTPLDYPHVNHSSKGILTANYVDNI